MKAIPPPSLSLFLSLCCCSGEKFLIRWYRGYLIAVSKGGRVVGGRAAVLTSSQGGVSEPMTLTIYDIQNQFVGKGSSVSHNKNAVQ